MGRNPKPWISTTRRCRRGFDADKINAGIAVAVAKIQEGGWDGDTYMITPDAAGRTMLETLPIRAPYDCVVIGGGLRIPPKKP